MKTVFYLCAGVILALGGCRSQKVGVSFSGLNGEWCIAWLNGNELAGEETNRILVFDAAARKLSGYAGCNRIAGNVEVGKERGGIRFLQVVSTRKACLDMRLEEDLLKALDRVRHFASGDETAKTVVFSDADHQRLFVLKRPAGLIPPAPAPQDVLRLEEDGEGD